MGRCGLGRGLVVAVMLLLLKLVLGVHYVAAIARGQSGGAQIQHGSAVGGNLQRRAVVGQGQVGAGDGHVVDLRLWGWGSNLELSV